MYKDEEKKKEKKQIEDANQYIEKYVSVYILRKIYPENNRYINFYHYREIIANNSKIDILESKKRDNSGSYKKNAARKVFEEVKLGIRGRTEAQANSVKGRLTDKVIHLSTGRYIYNVLLRQIYEEYNQRFNWLFYSMLPMGLGKIGVFLPAATIYYLPFLVIGTAVTLIGVGMYNSYFRMKIIRGNEENKIMTYQGFERELLEEKQKTQQFEEKIKLTDLIAILTNKDNILLLRYNLDNDLRKKLEILASKLEDLEAKSEDNLKISRISQKIIWEVSELNEEYDSGLSKKLSKMKEFKRDSQGLLKKQKKEQKNQVTEIEKTEQVALVDVEQKSFVQKKVSTYKELKPLLETAIETVETELNQHQKEVDRKKQAELEQQKPQTKDIKMKVVETDPPTTAERHKTSPKSNGRKQSK